MCIYIYIYIGADDGPLHEVRADPDGPLLRRRHGPTL